MADIAQRLVTHCGAALVIDYGYAETAFGDTLQAVRRHAYADPLASPGEADLTAHVDFASLARAARRAGAAAHGPLPQGAFLTGLGIVERSRRLSREAPAAMQEAVAAALRRLTAPDAMGTLFKVLAITPRGIEPPPFARSSAAP
jgi:SAM-dependent MidA family methyltransferase